MLPAQRSYAQEPTVRMEMASTIIEAGGDPFTASVVVENVTNLGAFQFDLTYDPAIVGFVEVQEGPFLGSSGREVKCLPPRSGEGSAGLTCVTLGATPDGPNGSGVLATITLQPAAPGSSPLHLVRLTLTDPPGQALPAQAQDATVIVTANNGEGGGFAWALWGTVIGGVVVAVAAAGGVAWWVRRSRPA